MIQITGAKSPDFQSDGSVATNLRWYPEVLWMARKELMIETLHNVLKQLLQDEPLSQPGL